MHCTLCFCKLPWLKLPATDCLNVYVAQPHDVWWVKGQCPVMMMMMMMMMTDTAGGSVSA